MNHQRAYVRVRAAVWLRTCPCGSRMYWIDGPQGTGRHQQRPNLYYCDECKRLEREDRSEVAYKKVSTLMIGKCTPDCPYEPWCISRDTTFSRGLAKTALSYPALQQYFARNKVVWTAR